MTIPTNDTSGTPAQQPGVPSLTEAEQAAVQKAREGFSEPQNVTALPQQQQAPQRPDWLPEKFWNAEKGEANYEALAKSYGELERTRSQPQQEPQQQPATRPDGKIEAPKEEPKDQPNPLTEAIARAREEWASGQAVSEDAVAALEAAGIPREIFDLYLEGVKAQTAANVEAIYKIAGGEEAYNAMTTWAAGALSAEEIDAFNSALDNPALREAAILGLQAKFQKARPSEGNLIGPSGTPAAAGDVFSSKEDYLQAMRDPRYQKDASYRAEVAAKLARSQAAGFSMAPRSIFERESYSLGR